MYSPSAAKRRDPRPPNIFNRFAASAREGFRATLPCVGKSEPNVLHSQWQLNSAFLNAGPSSHDGSYVENPPNASIGSPSYKNISRSQKSVPPSEPTKQNMASILHNAHDVSIGGDAHFLTVGQQKNFHINTYSRTFGLDILKEFVSFDALYDSSAQDPERRCHPGTRKNVLKQITNWADTTHIVEPIFWLHGPAGVGKSSIAQTFSRTYGSGKVAATFFFYRSDTSRNDGNRLFPTLAWQLAKSIPGARERIVTALNEDSDIPRKEIEAQFEYLIARPLRAIVETSSNLQASLPIVVIDGVDECLDEKLQQRFLDILRRAASSKCVPLRFLISSRPEAHIKDIFDKHRILVFDLANIDDAHRDIEKYLVAEFTRIASKQDIDTVTWPGERVIQDLVSRSSGQFIYASTVVKFVGDEYNSATSQLDIILGLEPLDGRSPFAALDVLYLEILQRQPDQHFLKDFLGLLVSPCEPDDYALLLKFNRKGLLRKLRGMHSVLKVKPEVEVYHRSFIDFIQEASRSGQYCASEQSGTRLYLDLIVGTLVRYATKMMRDPSYHGYEHFSPAFSHAVRDLPCRIQLPLQDWEKALGPLIGLKDQLLQHSNLSSFSAHGLCSECSVVYSIDDLLLHLAFYRGTSHTVAVPARHEPEPADSTLDDVDSDFASLLTLLRDRRSYTSDSQAAINLSRAVLGVDHIKAVSRIQSSSDAQSVVDFFCYVINNKGLLARYGSGITRNVTQLALGIYARVPLIPHLFLDPAALIEIEDVNFHSRTAKGTYQDKPIAIWPRGGYGINPICLTTLTWGTLSHENISPLLGICKYVMPSLLPRIGLVTPYSENGTLRHWRQERRPSVIELRERMLEVAEAFRHMHSLEIVLVSPVDGNQINLDSSFHAQVPGLCLPLRYCRDTPSAHQHLFPSAEGSCTYESNVSLFGRIFYEVYFDQDVPHDKISQTVKTRPREPEIDENTWQLIQWCCAEDPKARPTMDQIMEKMRSRKPAKSC